MNYIAFSPKSFKLLLKDVLLFYLVSFVFGGAALGMIYIVNSNNINIKRWSNIGELYIKDNIYRCSTGFSYIYIIILKWLSIKLRKKRVCFASIIAKLNKRS